MIINTIGAITVLKISLSFRGMSQTVKRLPTMRETRVWSLGGEDPLEKEMETHSSILAWKIPWTEEPSRLQAMGSQRVRHDWVTSYSLTEILKFNIQKTKIVASGPITSWEIDGETVETVADFIFLGSKITADGNCSHEFKRCLLPGRKLWPT